MKLIDHAVAQYCAKFNMEIPPTWCYPGDLIFDTVLKELFICGSNTKDVAELRRRNKSFKKVDIETLKQHLIERE